MCAGGVSMRVACWQRRGSDGLEPPLGCGAVGVVLAEVVRMAGMRCTTAPASTPQPAAQHWDGFFQRLLWLVILAGLYSFGGSTSVAERFDSPTSTSMTQPTVNRFGKRSDPYHPAQIKEVHSNKIGKTLIRHLDLKGTIIGKRNKP